MIYGLVLPVIEIFVAAYVMRNSRAVDKVVTYQLSIYAATPLAFYLNGRLLDRVGSKHLYAAGMLLSGVATGKQWSYFTEKWHPMVSDSYAASYANKAADGVYYNGGSWMRIEVCGYVTGKLHGWKKAEHAIANRLWAEIHSDNDFPTSQEYLPTDPSNPFFGYHRVFAWNSFVLQALEMAELRSSEMDPGYLEKAQGN